MIGRSFAIRQVNLELYRPEFTGLLVKLGPRHIFFDELELAISPLTPKQEDPTASRPTPCSLWLGASLIHLLHPAGL